MKNKLGVGRPWTGKTDMIRVRIKDLPDLEMIHSELSKTRNKIISKAEAISFLIEIGKEKLNILKD